MRKLSSIGPNPSGICMCGCGGKTKINRWSNTKQGYIRGTHRKYINGHHRIGCFKKGHKFYSGGEKGWFKKGHIPWSKEHGHSMGKNCRSYEKGVHYNPSGEFKKGEMDGDKHPQWTGGKTICNGYRTVYMPSHPRAFNNRVYEHVLVMENKIGRFISPQEKVHHIDFNPLNNDPNNLQLFGSNAEHLAFHNRTNKMRRDTCELLNQ